MNWARYFLQNATMARANPSKSTQPNNSHPFLITIIALLSLDFCADSIDEFDMKYTQRIGYDSIEYCNQETAPLPRIPFSRCVPLLSRSHDQLMTWAL